MRQNKVWKGGDQENQNHFVHEYSTRLQDDVTTPASNRSQSDIHLAQDTSISFAILQANRTAAFQWKKSVAPTVSLCTECQEENKTQLGKQTGCSREIWKALNDFIKSAGAGGKLRTGWSRMTKVVTLRRRKEKEGTIVFYDWCLFWLASTCKRDMRRENECVCVGMGRRVVLNSCSVTYSIITLTSVQRKSVKAFKKKKSCPDLSIC